MLADVFFRLYSGTHSEGLFILLAVCFVEVDITTLGKTEVAFISVTVQPTNFTQWLYASSYITKKQN
jgi:hypothetical protein